MSDETENVEPKSTEEIIGEVNQQMENLIKEILKLERNTTIDESDGQ